MRSIALHTLPERATTHRALTGTLSHWRCDLADNALTWSDGVYDLFGYVHGTPVDRRDVVEQYLGESRTTLDQLRAHAIATGVGFSMDARIERLDGSHRWFRLSAEVLRENGRSLALVGIKRDITDAVTRWQGGWTR